MPFEKPIGTIMHPLQRYPVLRANATILAAMQEMRRSMENAGPPHLIVVSDGPAGGETIQGFVTPEDLVFGIAGPFLEGARRTGPIFFEGLLEAECRQAKGKTVGEITPPVPGGIEEDEMLMEAIFLMSHHGVRLLPVTRDEEVTGVVHIEDVLREILQRTARR